MFYGFLSPVNNEGPCKIGLERGGGRRREADRRVELRLNDFTIQINTEVIT